MFSSCAANVNNCNAPPEVDDAVVLTSYKKQYLPNDEVTYQCRDKYTMEGERTLRCKDGEWEKRNITCTRTYIQKHFPKLHRML